MTNPLNCNTIHVYRWVSTQELKQVQNNKIISNHKISTQPYAKQFKNRGVFVFPRLAGAWKNAFFQPWGQIALVMKLSVDRVMVSGVGQYDGVAFPEMLISHYGVEDVVQVVHERELHDSMLYKCETGTFGEENIPVFLRC